MSIIPQFTILPFSDIELCNSWEIAIFAVSKDGCFERAKTVKIGGANPSNYRFVFQMHNYLTIKYML